MSDFQPEKITTIISVNPQSSPRMYYLVNSRAPDFMQLFNINMYFNFRSFLVMIYLYIRAIVRIILIIANNIYCLPTYLVWMTMLWPMKYINSKIYYKVEGMFYHYLLNMVTVWGHSAGYRIQEYGDQPEMYFEKRALVIANHQSTGDVPILMTAFNGKPMVVPNIMWVMDKVFKYTNFGIVCSYHQDFFIESVRKGNSSPIRLMFNLKLRSRVPKGERKLWCC